MTRDAPADFWSRRRAAVAAETQAEARAEEAVARQAEERLLEERPDEEILAALNLPAPEEMTDSAQVQALLRSAIPQRLRNRALRRLWRLNPIFSELDGLVEYGGDYTDAATVVPDMKTIYKVGKGMFDKLAEAAEQAEAKAAREQALAAARDEAEAPAAPEAADAPADSAGTVPAPAPGPLAQTAETADPAEPPAAPSPARRMRFRFDTA